MRPYAHPEWKNNKVVLESIACGFLFKIEFKFAVGTEEQQLSE